MRGLPEFEDPNLVVGFKGSSDAGVYRLSNDLMIVQSLDFFPPPVDDPLQYGQIAAANSLSDIYAMGGTPRTAMNIVGFPDDQLELNILNMILRGGVETILSAGAVLVGGHTVRDSEIKYGLSVTGTVEPERLITNSEAKPGDALVLTKAIGTGYVTTAFKAGKCPDATLNAAVDSMTQLNVLGRDAAQSVNAKAATDITGFGLAVHAMEMAQASGVTCVLNANKIPVLQGAADLAKSGYKTRASRSNREHAEQSLSIVGKPSAIQLELLFDAQTSGGLLISVQADQAETVVQHARSNGAHAATVVGHVEEKQNYWIQVQE
ncbi:MAG: selenide, water dikinase SelD [Planctomycetaceae bacterium]|nr:selenide, water dikinase SelD [Planctomycetaceae bacterium]